MPTLAAGIPRCEAAFQPTIAERPGSLAGETILGYIVPTEFFLEVRKR
jgi:hypothetical protein